VPEPTYYDVLGVPPDATQDEIQTAWKRQLKYWHPDHKAGPTAAARAKSLNRAHDELSDPLKRQEYDRMLAGGVPIDNGDDHEWAPAWTPPPGRYTARKPSRPRARPGPAAPPPPPAGAWASDPATNLSSSAPPGSGWTHVTSTHYRSPVWRYSLAAGSWVVTPLRRPTLTPGFIGAVAVRVVVLGGAAGLIWLSIPYLIAAAESG
jgi:hypothetical protein